MAHSTQHKDTEERYPMTDDQREWLTQDLLTVRKKIEEIAVLIAACYGSESQASFRVGEISSSIQRFEWELERQLSKA